MRDALTSLRFTVSAMLTISLLISCTSPTPTPNKPTFAIDSLAIVPADELVAIGRADTEVDRAGAGAAVGASGVGVSGALLGAVTCAAAGPLGSLVCALMLGSMGAVAGGLGGTVYRTTGVSETDALYLNEILSYLDQKRNLTFELSTEIEDRIPKHKQVPQESADAVAVVNLVSILFTQKSKETLWFTATASMTLIENSNVEPPAHSIKTFEVDSPSSSIDDWLSEDGLELAGAIDTAIVDLSRQMATYLSEIALTSKLRISER